MLWCIERGRATRPKLKIGICGEHGGESASVKFCHQAGLDYVSASPFLVPIARLAAAQAVIEERAGRKRGKKKGGKKREGEIFRCGVGIWWVREMELVGPPTIQMVAGRFVFFKVKSPEEKANFLFCH